MESVTLSKPAWALEYEGRDISRNIAPYVLSITYTDALEGESDDLEITLEDRDHRWKSGWWPQRGDRVRLRIGYEGEGIMDCGSFQVDEVELNGPPDTVSMRALAAGVTSALRTARSAAYENMTFEAIARGIAERHGLRLTGSISERKRLRRPERVTQREEGDLQFLKRLGEAEGVVFSIKDGQLVWHDQDRLDAAAGLAAIDRRQMIRFVFRAKTQAVYRACQVSYHDPKTAKEITYTYEAPGIPTGDTLKLQERCENYDDAVVRARAALRRHNSRQIEGAVTEVGNPRRVAGANVGIAGLGVIDGVYQIIKVRHRLERSRGYVTESDLTTTGAENKSLRNLRNERRLVKR